MSTRIAFFAVLLAACSLSTAAHAAVWPDVSSDVPANGLGANDAAILIGIGNYFALPDIDNADRNATDWNTYLQKTRGVPGRNVRMMLNEEATKENIIAAVTEATQQVKPGGTLWFVYIGHGAPAPSHEDGLILGSDTQVSENSLVARGVAQKDILAIIDAGPQKDAVVIFDACFSGSTGDGKPLVPGSQATIPVKRIEPSVGRTAILSASDVVAGPLPRHDRPAFSYLLLGSMRGWADANKDKTVMLNEAFGYTKEVLLTMVNGRTQVPSLRGNTQSTLATNAAETGPDLVAIQNVLGPAPDMFKSKGMTAPTIDTSMFSGAGFSGNISIAVERARDDALDAAESTVASATVKRDSWCKLSNLDGVNPYKEEATKLCASWGTYVDDEAKLSQTLSSDYSVLVDYLGLRRRTTEDKQRAVASFIDVYGKYAERQELQAAKIARDNLANGAPAGISHDTDNDGLLIDSCPEQAEDKDGDQDDDGCPELDLSQQVEKTGFQLHAVNFGYFRLDLGVGLGFGLWDQPNVPEKFDQVSFRPLLGLSTRMTFAFLEAGLQGDWDLSRDLDDGGAFLSGQLGARIFGLGPWTPSVGVDYRNILNLTENREGGAGLYFANTLNFFEGMSGRLTYRYGLDPPGRIVPVHTLLLEIAIVLADPKGSAFFEVMGEMCD